MADVPPNELKAAIAAGRALIVCGAGVSRAATDGKAPGWAKLIEEGLEEAAKLNGGRDKPWVKACEALLASDEVGDWLNAADDIQAKLGGPSGGPYRAFFRQRLGGLKATRPAILRAIKRLADAGNRIATTNYDHLISQALHWDRADWTDHLRVIEALRHDPPAVWHIHGDYDHPPSIVFSQVDYQRIVKTELPQFAQQKATLDFTLVFVGCSSAGLADDNVGELLKWLHAGFSGLGDKHFVLVADDDKDKWPAGVTAVKFGAHENLPAYLESLAPPSRSGATFPPDPNMIGRADRRQELVAAILDQDRPIVVPGALGMGKTTLALAAAYDPTVVAIFGAERRVFVNLEPVPDAEGVSRALAAALGLDASGAAAAVEQAIADFCAVGPALAILDNFETPWRKEKAATEAMLGRLAAIKGLRLIATARDEPPHIPGGGVKLRDVESLAIEDARALFLREAGAHHAADPALPKLLEALDGHPLSIELLAANAAGKADLKSLLADWDDRHAAMLRRGDGDSRLTSLRVSLDISLAALGADSAAHRLLRVMALLPAGMASGDCVTALADGAPTEAERGAAVRLEAARLASHRGNRWRLLAPVRETLLQDYPPQVQDKARLVNLFLERAALGKHAGTASWANVRDGVMVEAGNFDTMVGFAAAEATPAHGLGEAVTGLAKFHFFTGVASVASLTVAATSFGKVGDLFEEANCILRLGDIAIARSNYDGAREHYGVALPLFRNIGATQGEAVCIARLGEIALFRSDQEGARGRYEAALPLFGRIGDANGEANCIARLGEIALARSDYEGARRHYEAALVLQRQVGNVQGEANCIEGLGDIARHRSDYPGAAERYEAALPLFRRVGAVQGEANCIQNLGEIAFRRSDYGGARERYEAALGLYRTVGDVLGEANCIQYLGDIDEANKDFSSARLRWNEALALYSRVAEPYSIGGVHLRFARRAATPAEAAAHREAARQAWASIGRADLIAKFLDKAP
jgi:tetratricopeptide (TPR) repeat protein